MIGESHRIDRHKQTEEHVSADVKDRSHHRALQQWVDETF